MSLWKNTSRISVTNRTGIVFLKATFVVALVGGLLFITLLLSFQLSRQQHTHSQPDSTALELSPESEFEYVNRLSKAIQFKTVSIKSGVDDSEFYKFNQFIFEEYPHVMEELELVHKSKHSLLLSLKGADSSKDPILLIAHSDVVPAQLKSFSPVRRSQDDEWIQPPFSGVVDDLYIWGRGTLDNKSAIMAILT